MKTIFKYKISVTDEQIIEINGFIRVLTVQLQKNVPCIWVLCIPSEPKVKLKLRVFGTGQPIDERMCSAYVGSWQEDDTFIWHLFVESID